MSKGELLKTIRKKLDAGASKDEIFKEFSKSEDAKVVSNFLALFPTRQLKDKYKLQNSILAGLLLLSAVLKTYLGLLQFSLIGPLRPSAAIFIMLLPFINLFFFFDVLRYHSAAYKVLTFLCVLSFIQISVEIGSGSINFSSLHFINVLNLVMISLISVIGIFSFYLGNKLFPYFKGFGPKKDLNGHFIYQ